MKCKEAYLLAQDHKVPNFQVERLALKKPVIPFCHAY